MPTTGHGIVYPTSAGNVNLWEHIQNLADSVETALVAENAKTLYAIKGSNESLASNTTLQDDDELFLTLPVGIWHVEVIIGYTGSTAGDIKVAWTWSGTNVATAARVSIGPAVLTADVADTNVKVSGFYGIATAGAFGADPGGAANFIREDMVFNVTGSGVLQLQWAQNSSSVTNTTVQAGSRIFATRVD